MAVTRRRVPPLAPRRVFAYNQGTATEAWLLIGKRRSGGELISIEEAPDVALCHGWIDGQRKPHNGVSFLQRYSRVRGQALVANQRGQGGGADGGRAHAAGRARPPESRALVLVQPDVQHRSWDAGSGDRK
jgi:hypothetical protein